MSETETTIASLVEVCKYLKLRYVREELREVAITARAQRWDPLEVIRVLLEAEKFGRSRSGTEKRRLKAKLPTGKTFDTWDPSKSHIPRATFDGLRSLEWIKRGENLVICGPSGTGKSHFSEALGHQAIDNGLCVLWFGIEDLGALIRRHRIDDSISRALVPIARADLVIIDDLGMLPVSSDAAEGLYRVIDTFYERRSVALSSNLHPAALDQVMDKNIATALVDRLLHHAHVVVTEGNSVRLQEATSGKGVVPLAG